MSTRVRPGERFARYQILERLGAGAMGEVYKARRDDLNRVVALKILKPEASGDDRLLQEARAIAQSDDHPNIVAVYDVGFHDGLHYIEMQFVDGPSLATRLKSGPLAPEEATFAIGQAARALAHAHRRGVIHRDIKPGNLLQTTDGTLKVADFGLARANLVDEAAVGPATVCGTPPYMAPEILQQKRADWRADQYSLGVTFYELLTGRYPFDARQIVLLSTGADVPIPDVQALNPNVSKNVASIIRRMLNADPQRRFADWSELTEALKPSGPASESLAHGTAIRSETTNRRRRWNWPRHLLRSVLLSFLVGAAVASFERSGALERGELLELDALYRMASATSSTAETEVVVVEIDQESKDRLSSGQPLVLDDEGSQKHSRGSFQRYGGRRHCGCPLGRRPDPRSDCGQAGRCLTGTTY